MKEASPNCMINVHCCKILGVQEGKLFDKCFVKKAETMYEKELDTRTYCTVYGKLENKMVCCGLLKFISQLILSVFS